MGFKKIIIIGTRTRNEEEDFQSVYNEFKKWYNNGDIIISGGCPKGGDRFAEIIASRLGLTEANGKLIIHRPKKPLKHALQYVWVKVFYDRNTVVANEAEDDTVIIACVSKSKTGGGTGDTLSKIKKGIIVKV